MSDLKTRRNDGDVDDYLEKVEPKQKRQDCLAPRAMMEEITGEPAMMWGDSIVGFGSYHYVYASGREGDWLLTGFAPRQRNLTIHIMAGFDNYGELLDRLGKHKTSVSCLYINKLADVDEEVLRELIAHSVAEMRTRYQD